MREGINAAMSLHHTETNLRHIEPPWPPNTTRASLQNFFFKNLAFPSKKCFNLCTLKNHLMKNQIHYSWQSINNFSLVLCILSGCVTCSLGRLAVAQGRNVTQPNLTSPKNSKKKKSFKIKFLNLTWNL